MASDLISRKVLLEEYDRVHVGEPGGARKLIAEAPAVNAVEVVRCFECVNRGDPDKCPMCYQSLSEWYPRDNTDDEGFCHYGKRREERCG